jgi:hypothetical protein
MKYIMTIMFSSLLLVSCAKQKELTLPGRETVGFIGKQSADAGFQTFIKQYKFVVRNNGVGDGAFQNQDNTCWFDCFSNRLTKVVFLGFDESHSGTLPYELELADTPRDVIKKLGTPIMDGIGEGGVVGDDPDRRVMDYDMQSGARLVIQFIENRIIQLSVEKQ